MNRGKANHHVTVTVELMLTKAELDVLTRLTGSGAQTNEEVCTDILMRHFRYHSRARRRSLLGEEDSHIPRPIVPYNEDTGMKRDGA